MANDNKSDKRVSLTSRVTPTKRTTQSAQQPTKRPSGSGGSVNLSQRTKTTAKGGTGKKAAKKPVGKTIMWTLMALLVVLCIVLFLIVYPLIKDMFGGGSSEIIVPDEDVIGFTQTPSEISDKVNYYLVGLFGEEITEQMDSLALVCYDKDAGKVNVMEVPTDTILSNDDDHWTVRKIGNVWGNPKAIDWCDECKKRVFDPEIENKTHTVCGAALTSKEGSAPTNLIEAFNYEFSMPIDNYYLFQHGSLKETVDFLGGLDVKLEPLRPAARLQKPALFPAEWH